MRRFQRRREIASRLRVTADPRPDTSTTVPNAVIARVWSQESISDDEIINFYKLNTTYCHDRCRARNFEGCGQVLRSYVTEPIGLVEGPVEPVLAHRLVHDVFSSNAVA